MTKSPIEQAKEVLAVLKCTCLDGITREFSSLIEYAESLERKNKDLLKEGVFDKSKIKQLNRQVESLERQLKKPDCPKCYDTGKLHGCQKMTEHGLKYYSKDCDCLNVGE